MTKILAVADEVSPLLYDYFDPERWRDIDLILSCGDLPPEYLDPMCTMLGVPVVYVRGNHDGAYEASRYDGYIDADGKIVTAANVRIAGFEGSPWYNGGRYQRTERQMQRVLWRSRLRASWFGPPDIILTHAAPAGCHDGTDPAHRGFEAFNEAIRIWKPAYLVHGHSHAYERGEAISTIGTTTVINAFPYRVFELPNSRRLPVDEKSNLVARA